MEKKSKKPEGKTLKETLKDIREKFGPESIMTLDEQPHVDVEALSTGSIGIDEALGIGGLPRGRIVEVFGPESSGKTTLALQVVAQAQKLGETCAFIDAENAMDPQYAKKLGVKIEELLIAQPGSGEEGLQIVDALVEGGKVSVIVVDSVAALTPRSVIEGEIGEVKIGALARLMSQSLNKLTSKINKTKCIVIFINQIRMTMMTFGGANPETTTGGKALKFYASVRIDIRMIASIKKGDEKVGSRVRVKIVKNKVAAPFKVAELDILYNEGISYQGELLAMGEKFSIVTKSGNSYEYGDIKLGRGYDASRQFLKENEEVAERIRAEIMAKMRE